MTSLAIVESKLSQIRKYLTDLEDFKKYTSQQIKQDKLIQAASERYLYLAIQAAIDLAEAIVAYKNLRKPAALRESFEILRENNLINQELADKMGRAVGFRNILAHQYDDIDYDIVYDVLQNRLPDIEQFIEAIDKEIFN